MDTFKNYDCTLDEVRQTLERDGIAVLPGILPPERCEELRERAWADFGRLISLDRENPATFANFFQLEPRHSMLVQKYPLGHLQWVWDIRQDENVVQAFANIWQVAPEDLLVSFDAISLHLPPEVTQEGWFNGQMSIHTDQSHKHPYLCCVQGMVNLYPVEPGDGTLCVMEGSHHHFADFFRETGAKANNHWYRLKPNQYAFFEARGCPVRRVLASQGSLILWDSRTFHMGSEPMSERAQPNFRLVSYISMLPRHGVDEDILKAKQKALRERRLTTHWANAANLFPAMPENVVRFTLEDIGRPQLSALGQRLAGFN